MYNLGARWNHEKPDQSEQLAKDMVGPSPLGYLYRFEWDRQNLCMKLCCFKIVKKTPKGWQIQARSYTPGGRRSDTKYINESSFRRFAWATIPEAIVSYQQRKSCYAGILQAQLEMAQRSLEAADPDRISRQELDFLID